MKPSLLVLLLCAPLLAAELPEGSAPPPVPVPHFPDALHAVVWRNWDLAPTERIARTVGATEEQINAIASSMGLPPNRPIPEKHKKQIYITIVRRNWHMLPYDQLLTMLDMTAEELAFGLREDDFLFHKLGQIKPKCPPVRYAEPNEAARKRAAEIKSLVQEHFGDALRQPGEPRFAFIEKLSQPLPQASSPKPQVSDRPRFIYSYFGVFGDPLLEPSLDPYPEGLLQRLAETGVNGVWLHVVLRQLAPGGPDFPEFGQDHEKRLQTLRQLVERCARHGIQIYLYMNEPRAQPNAFFANRPDMAGIVEGDHTAMCTSNPRVRKWMSDALTHVFKTVPGLGGVFTITASENLTHCASHFTKQNCPRCKERSEAQIIAEVNAAIEQGVHRGDSAAKVLCWDWGWNLHGDASEHIALLPDNVWLMSVSEWDQPFERGGVKGQVGEYSMSVVGPGPRAVRHWKLAQERGLKSVAKVAFNNTWELSAVPWLPVLDLVAEHCRKLNEQQVDGLMLSWSLGGYPSPNLQVAQRILGHKNVDVEKVLNDIAVERYGPNAAHHARKAWTTFSEAFQHFPYNGSVVYSAPLQVGPANLLHEKPTGYSATMVGLPYDHLDAWRGPYPREVFASQMHALANNWILGFDPWTKVVRDAQPARSPTALSDMRLSVAAFGHFKSVANQASFIIARDALGRPDASASYRKQLRDILETETDIARRHYELCKTDSRIGFEATNHYYYTPLDLVEKVINCEYLKTRFAP